MRHKIMPQQLTGIIYLLSHLDKTNATEKTIKDVVSKYFEVSCGHSDEDSVTFGREFQHEIQQEIQHDVQQEDLIDDADILFNTMLERKKRKERAREMLSETSESLPTSEPVPTSDAIIDPSLNSEIPMPVKTLNTPKVRSLTDVFSHRQN